MEDEVEVEEETADGEEGGLPASKYHVIVDECQDTAHCKPNSILYVIVPGGSLPDKYNGE